LIVYELFTGERIFKTETEALQYPPRIPHLYYWKHGPVPPPYQAVPEVSIAARIMSTPLDHPDNLARNHIKILWDAVKLMKKTEPKFLGEVNDFTIQSRLEEVNTLVSAMLNLNPMHRPSIEVLEHHFRVNVIRSMVENDVVSNPLLPS
jgi:serine/threonine protein kinase